MFDYSDMIHDCLDTETQMIREMFKFNEPDISMEKFKEWHKQLGFEFDKPWASYEGRERFLSFLGY